MPRRVRSADLETRSRRLRLPIHKNPQCPVSIGQGLTLEYRRCKGPGRWVVKVADGQGGNYEVTLPNIVADDFELADGEHILDFWMACDKARVLARGGRGGGRPETLAEAITSYEADLKLRDGDLGNATRIRHHLPTWLLNKPVPMLLERDFLRLRNDMIARGIRGPNLSRTFKVLRAVLNLAARHDKRILNRDQWRDGLRLAGINTFKTRNQILDDDQVRRIVAESYRLD